MTRRLCIAVVIMMLMAAGNSFAGNIDAACPSTVHYGTGTTTLNVTVTFTNYDCSPVTYQRYMAGLITNSDATLGGAGIYGPFPKNLTTPIIVPAATCSTTHLPGIVTKIIPVTNAVPNVTGKMGAVFVEFLTAKGKSMGDGQCMVSIVP